MDSKTKYVVPQELIDIYDDHRAAHKARDAAVKGVFKFQLRNALFFGRVSEQKGRDFWTSIREQYPELTNAEIYLNLTHMTVYNIDKADY